MNSLLIEINKNANDIVVESAIIAQNLDRICEVLSMSRSQLNEAVTTWLAKVRNTIANGRLDPQKKDSVIKILAAISAISNPDLAAALDEKGNLGAILYKAGNTDQKASNEGLQQLLMIGRHPSLSSFVEQAAQAVDNPQGIDAYTKKLQVKIEPIMNKKMAIERKRAHQ